MLLSQVSLAKLVPDGAGQLALLVVLACLGFGPMALARMSSSPPLLFTFGLFACIIYGVVIIEGLFALDSAYVWTSVG